MQWYHSKITTICSLEIAFLLAGDGDSAATVHHQIGPSSFRQFYLISRPTTRNHFPPDVHLDHLVNQKQLASHIEHSKLHKHLV